MVLSRRRDEKIIIQAGSDEIVLTLCDIRGDKARIGLDAPEHVRIFRQEVLERQQAESQKASSGN